MLFFDIKSEPSRCFLHRNGSDNQHTFTMPSAFIPIGEVSEKDKRRFWRRVNKNGPIIREDLGPCWEWTGKKDRKGYGKLNLLKRGVFSHRFSFSINISEIEASKPFVLHRCDNPPCCNPKHLFCGTQQDNIKDMKSKGRGAIGDRVGSRTHPERVSKGEHRWCSKLNNKCVLDIRNRYKNGGISQIKLALEYGVW